MEKHTSKLFAAVFFLGLSLYYLSFTGLNWLEQRKIDGMDQEARAAYIRENGEKVVGLREKSLNLGLDLQGGIHVTLEVQVDQLLHDLAGERANANLDSLIQAGKKASVANNTPILDEFITAFESANKEARLSAYYQNDGENISRRSSNDEVKAYLAKQVEAALGRAMEIVRTRVDRFGVAEPSIVRQGNSRIIVELPGVDDEERVRKLLKGTARLEFRLAADPVELRGSLEQIAEFYMVRPDSTVADSLAQATNKLLEVMNPDGQGVVFGTAAATDTATVNKLLADPAVKAMLPRETVLMWTSAPAFTDENKREYFRLIGVRTNVELTGDVITEARPEFDQYTNSPEVSMTMNRDGAKKWARITGANVGKPIAITLDNYVYTYPNVITKISDGRSSITGLESINEAEDLVNILLSGALPAPLDIIEERTVGPSLGAASIRAGMNTAIAGLAIVAIFMMFYYRSSGSIADLTLVLNMIFLLGIMAAFKATLTLPGIAGIVLTIGMAVDANVLIFERIREERAAGKSVRAAVDAGYSNALSAILDSNITTFLTGAILFSFGVGPIKGFAVTLMAGIASSLFAALIISRVIIDLLVSKNENAVSFG
jgi:preprotein translocase subunit SecD